MSGRLAGNSLYPTIGVVQRRGIVGLLQPMAVAGSLRGAQFTGQSPLAALSGVSDYI
jgi:hypothetical protein